MNQPKKSIEVAVWIIATLSAAVFVLSGAGKLSGAMIGQFEEWGYTPAFALTIGVLEIAGAIGLLIPRASGWAALGLIVIMFGALGTHLMEANFASMWLPAVMLVLLSLVLFGRGLGLRVRPSAVLRTGTRPAASGI